MTIIKILVFLIMPFILFDYSYAQLGTDDLFNMDLEQLMNIEVITVTKRSGKKSDVPATVKVITAKQIEEKGCLTLEEALSDLPGFQFRNIQGFNSYIFQRGIPSQNNLILVLVDGIQINELNSGGFYAGGHYNMSNIEKIEVVYGPASVLYGTNAISGIVNIITKNAKDNRGLDVNAVYGTFNTLSTDISYGYHNEEKNLGLIVSGMYKQFQKGNLKDAKDNYNWSDSLENYEKDLALDIKLLYKDLIFACNYQKKMTSNSIFIKSDNTEYDKRRTIWNISFVNTYLKHQTQINNNLDILSQAYYRITTVNDNSVKKTDTNQIGYYRPNSLLGFESTINYVFSDKLTVIGGLLFEYEELSKGFSKTYSSSYNETPPAPEEPDKNHNRLFSSYLQAQYLFLDDFRLTAGLRYDNSSVYNQIVTPRGGIVYSKDKLTLKALYHFAYRAPKPWDYTWGIGNPNLEPEKIRSYEFVSSYLFFDNLYFDMSLYYNMLDNILIKGRVGDDDLRLNAGKATTTGIELNGNYILNKFNVYANYTYNDSKDEAGTELKEISKHTANMGIKYIINKNTAVNLWGNFIGKRKNPVPIASTGSEYIDEAIVLNASCHYNDFYDFGFTLTVKNLLDKEYYHSSNNYVPERYRQAQRTILFRINYNFAASTNE